MKERHKATRYVSLDYDSRVYHTSLYNSEGT